MNSTRIRACESLISIIAAYRRFPREGLRKFKGNFKSTERLKASPPFPDGVTVIACTSSLELSRQIHAQCLLLHEPHSPGHGIPLPAGNVFIQWTRTPSPGPSLGPSPAPTDVVDDLSFRPEREVDERPGLADEEVELSARPGRKVFKIRAKSEKLFTDDDDDDYDDDDYDDDDYDDDALLVASHAPRRRQVASDDEDPSKAKDTRESTGASPGMGEEGSQAGENGDAQEDNAKDTRESAGASPGKGEEGSQAGENGDVQEEAWWLMDTGDVFRDA
jgi:hypothetical protein